MKIAVAYNDGQVFQHFGHTEQFKIYEITDGAVSGSTIVDTNGQGHGALADFLMTNEVKVVICGGMGAGAKEALDREGIEAVTGVTGAADEAVQSYLKGELESSGVNCDHHDHHDHEEGGGCHCGGGCGDSCGGGCGGCHEPAFEGKNVGRTVKTHYEGTFNDGTKFDSSYDRGEPLEFVCGAGMMIPGFDKAVKDMEVGDIINVHLMPEEAYGEVDPSLLLSFEIEKLPGSENLELGQTAYLRNSYGQPFPVKVTEKTETTIVLDANNEMAGKELNFKIEMVEIN